jgi:hypothetical protein
MPIMLLRTNVKQSLTLRNHKRLPRRFTPRNDRNVVMQTSF